MFVVTLFFTLKMAAVYFSKALFSIYKDAEWHVT